MHQAETFISGLLAEPPVAHAVLVIVVPGWRRRVWLAMRERVVDTYNVFPALGTRQREVYRTRQSVRADKMAGVVGDTTAPVSRVANALRQRGCVRMACGVLRTPIYVHGAGTVVVISA